MFLGVDITYGVDSFGGATCSLSVQQAVLSFLLFFVSVQRNFLSKSLKTLRTFTSQAQTDPEVEKTVAYVPELKTRWPSDFQQPEEVIPPVIEESNPVSWIVSSRSFLSQY